MAIGCGAKCAKFMLIVFNIIFWLSGCAILAVGIWMRVDPSILNTFKVFSFDESDPMLEYAAYLLIALGAFVFLVGFLGCCGAIKENKCMLGFYIFMLLLIMAGELAVGIMAIVYKDKVVGITESKLLEQLRKDKIYESQKDNKITFTAYGVAISAAQVELECCGITGFADYSNSKFENTTGEAFPLTCCKMKPGTDFTNDMNLDESIQNKAECQKENVEYLNTRGCNDGLKASIEQNAVILIGLGIGVACIEIFGFIFAICLCRNTGSDD